MMPLTSSLTNTKRPRLRTRTCSRCSARPSTEARHEIHAEEIAAGVRAIIQDQVEAAHRNDRPAPDVLPHKTLADDLGLDSLDKTEVLMRAEERFGVELPGDELRHETTVADLFEMVADALRDRSERDARAASIKSAWEDAP